MIVSFFGRPILSTVIIGACIFLAFYFAFYWPRRKLTFDFDPGGRYGEFEKHAERYQSLARLMLTLSSASVAFLINFLVNVAPDAKNRNSYSLKLESASPRTIALLCLSATCALGFLLCQNLFYEDYVHSKYSENPARSRETYTGARYALTLTLAGAGLAFFFFAFMFLAFWLFD